jgi:hypothetical protein
MQARNFPSGILTEANQIRKKGRAQQTHRNSLFRGILDPFGVFPRKFCVNCVGALRDLYGHKLAEIRTCAGCSFDCHCPQHLTHLIRPI